MPYGYIYKIINTVNGKLYIGQTTYQEPLKRWWCHLSSARALKANACPVLCSAINKYGESSFVFKIIMSCRDREHLDQAEGMCIRLFKSSVDKNGYNLACGGNGHKHSEETKRKMSETRKNNPNLCKTRLGSKCSIETRAKMSLAAIKSGNRPPHTPESIEKMRQTKLGQPNLKSRGQIRSNRNSKFCIIDGVIYQSVTLASHILEIPKQSLRGWLDKSRLPKLTCEYL